MRPLIPLVDAIIKLIPSEFPVSFICDLETLKQYYLEELTSEEYQYYEDLCHILNNNISMVNTEWTKQIYKLLHNEIHYLDVLNA